MPFDTADICSWLMRVSSVLVMLIKVSVQEREEAELVLEFRAFGLHSTSWCAF